MTTAQKIIEYITENRQASGREVADYLNSITLRAVRKQLKNLLDAGVVRKIGRPPKVYYLIDTKKNREHSHEPGPALKAVINKRYYYISPSGIALSGWTGFEEWCKKTKQDPVKAAHEYVSTLAKYDKFRKNNLIDGMQKMESTFREVFLDKLFYLDFYSIERFGKTKLGQLLLYAKQSQDKKLIRQLIQEISPRINSVVKKYDISGILYIPPTVKREVQFMKELERELELAVRNISVAKIKTEIIIPQKTLSKLEDRIENAKNTIVIDDQRIYKNVLLIDDAVGSGATLNETARQLKAKKLVRGTIIGLAITGSFKGFDVISEV